MCTYGVVLEVPEVQMPQVMDLMEVPEHSFQEQT
jgi:hypothetical protein